MLKMSKDRKTVIDDDKHGETLSIHDSIKQFISKKGSSALK